MNQLAQLQRALQAHVIDGELAIADAIDSSTDIPAATRLQIYADAYRLRLIDGLQANYPVLAQLLGEETFARMAQEYLAIYPSRHYSVRWFGHRLAEFLSEFADYRDQQWLHELASWEWKIATAFDASDATALTPSHLSAVAPEEWPQLQFTFHPSVQRISLDTNVAAIIKADGNGERLPVPTKLDVRTEWLIWRQDLTVQYRSLDAAEKSAIDVAINSATFEEICEAIVGHVADEQVPLCAVNFLKQWITDQCLIESTTS